jgi:ABC-type branched-subunit amino acid transport system substrate-binding protein
MFAMTAVASAQITKWQSVHVVQKKETLFGITHQYGITMEQLAEANPEITAKGYKLKKGSTLFIPYPKPSVEVVSATPLDTTEPVDDMSSRALRMAVVLPLHSINGDGKRMIEYYRGILMACDSLKRTGMSIDVRAWNTASDADINTIAKEVEETKPDLIVGPLYSSQVEALSVVAEHCNAKLLIPFSINAPKLLTCSNIFQVYQSPIEQSEAAVELFMKEYGNTCHPVIIDCGDSVGARGSFTTALRRELDVRGIAYSVTSLNTPTASFVKTFSTDKANVVVLNSARQQSLNSAFGKLSAVQLIVPDVKLSMFGYSDWMLYTRNLAENFYKYQVCIPSAFYVNLNSPSTKYLLQKYKKNFNQDMMASYPRFALTGFDHTCFFLKGLRQRGRQFSGARHELQYAPVQTPLHFERIGAGGYQNRVMRLIRYTTSHTVEWVEK